jgi:hypothetical protein
VIRCLSICLLFVNSGCEREAQWQGWVYPNKFDLTDDIPIGAYPSLVDCRKSARNILERAALYKDGERVPGDYECGFDCELESGAGGLNVCKKTER